MKVMESHQHWVKNVINCSITIICFFVFNTSSSQIIKGNYFEVQKKGMKNFNSSFKFNDKELFSYEYSGDTGLIRYGEGSYEIKNDYLVLDFNATKASKEPYYKLGFYKTYRDSITVKVISKDFKGNIVPNASVIYKKVKKEESTEKKKETILDLKMFDTEDKFFSKDQGKTRTNNKGVAILKLKRENVNSIIRIFSRKALKPIYAKLINTNNYVIEVFFNDKGKRGIPFKDVKWNYKIIEIKNNSIRLKDEKGNKIVWKNIDKEK